MQGRTFCWHRNAFILHFLICFDFGLNYLFSFAISQNVYSVGGLVKHRLPLHYLENIMDCVNDAAATSEPGININIVKFIA